MDEVSGGVVSELSVTSTADRDVLIVDGEELVGALQNRTVNVTLVVAAQSTGTIPVACVERGRWHLRTAHFAAGRSHLYPSLRASRAASVTASLKRSGSRAADQRRVWDDIAAKSRRMGVRSRTEAMLDIFHERLDDPARLEGVFAWRESQCGVWVFMRGGFAGGDLFGSPQLCSSQLPRLTRGFYLDSLDSAPAFPRLHPDEVLPDIRAGRHSAHRSPGRGVEVRFRGRRLHGAWILDGGAVPHVALFPRMRPGSPSRRPGPPRAHRGRRPRHS